ncbi:MAG: hypothetical protein KJ760_19145 [Proteobacteria bacterium]|nr:hypothetical protein [Pseudomonadota bacterium]
MPLFLDGKRSDSVLVDLGSLTVEASSDVTQSFINAGMAASNKAVILEPDLSVTRDNAVVFLSGLVVSILEKGTGIWSLTFENVDNTVVTLTSAEVVRRDTFAGEFLSIRLTNLAQVDVIAPKFWIGKRV